MRRRPRWSDFLGGLTLTGALLLSSPGVQVARADSAAARSGPVCSSAALRPRQNPSLEMFLSGIRQQAVAQRSSERGEPDGWVVLNTRGYNYTAARKPPPKGSRTSQPAAPIR